MASHDSCRNSRASRDGAHGDTSGCVASDRASVTAGLTNAVGGGAAIDCLREQEHQDQGQDSEGANLEAAAEEAEADGVATSDGSHSVQSKN